MQDWCNWSRKYTNKPQLCQPCVNLSTNYRGELAYSLAIVPSVKGLQIAQTSVNQARSVAMKALALDPDNALAELSLGLVA